MVGQGILSWTKFAASGSECWCEAEVPGALWPVGCGVWPEHGRAALGGASCGLGSPAPGLGLGQLPSDWPGELVSGHWIMEKMLDLAQCSWLAQTRPGSGWIAVPTGTCRRVQRGRAAARRWCFPSSQSRCSQTTPRTARSL